MPNKPTSATAVPGVSDDSQLTVAQANDFLAAARSRVAGGQTSFDLSALTHVDSTALAVLLALRREAPCRFNNPGTNLRKLADLYGVESLLFESN